MTKKLELTGKVFGRLTVIEECGRTKAGKTKWLCKCSCGNLTTPIGSGLINGGVLSCGCYKSETTSKLFKTHGMSGTKEYNSWFDMKRRCLDPNNDHYEDYAGRGITIHVDFIESFDKWYEEIGEKPKDRLKYSVGRIDNNGNYTYGNIRWELNATQARNHSKQRNNTSGITGVGFSERDKTWVSRWVELDGARKIKCFSISKYGNEVAKQMAIDFRNQTIARLNSEGAGYAASHGSDKGVK